MDLCQALRFVLLPPVRRFSGFGPSRANDIEPSDPRKLVFFRVRPGLQASQPVRHSSIKTEAALGSKHPASIADQGCRVISASARASVPRQASWARAELGWLAFQFQGSSSSRRLAGWSGRRARTSASQACGSTSLSLAVSISV